MTPKFKPIIIKSNKYEPLEYNVQLEIAKHTLKGIEYACEYKYNYINVCNIISPVVNGLSSVTSLAINSNDYVENLETILPILEEAEEYESCARILELIKLIPTITFIQAKLDKSILNTILDL